ncbi:MAG: hypothetical protein FWB75_02750 [Oscillospiraceae bacterium]|nr:hypothetical protein [Oscillospiraceae bacterium]
MSNFASNIALAFDAFRDLVAMIDVVEPYFDDMTEGANFSDYVYRRNHIRVAIRKDGNIISFFPLGSYTPNFFPEKLKEVALSAEPYLITAPEIKMHDSKDPEVQARIKGNSNVSRSL